MRKAHFTTFTRLGFAARGLLYLTVAWLVIGTGRTEDLSGAMRYLATGTERWLLVVVAIGLVAYGLWRLSDAAMDIEGHGDGRKALAKRAGAAASGIVHLFLAYQAWELISEGGGGSGGGPEQQAQTVLHLPAGGILLFVGAAVLLVAGVWQIVKASKCSFLDTLAPTVRENEALKWLGRIGYAARGVIFIVTAWFVAQASLSGRASEAGGMEQALNWLSGPVAVLIAVGLALFGVFSLIEARYRIIHEPQAPQFAG